MDLLGYADHFSTILVNIFTVIVKIEFNKAEGMLYSRVCT